tara:strand:+ start:68 stop:496 length:429 start_codon:yes stop_codon:yes gene_type:complete
VVIAESKKRKRWLRAAALVLAFGLGCYATFVASVGIDGVLHPSFQRGTVFLTGDELAHGVWAVVWLAIPFLLGLASASMLCRRLSSLRLSACVLSGMACGVCGGLALRAPHGGLVLGLVIPLLVGLIVGLVGSPGSLRDAYR